MRTQMKGWMITVIGIILGTAAVVTAQIVVTPGQVLYWDQSAASLAEAGTYRITRYEGVNADKVRVNPNDATAGAGNLVTFTCTGAASPYRCTSNVTAQTLAGGTAPGLYKVTLVAELRRADGTYAPRVASQICDFSFADTRPSIAPTGLGFQ